MLVAILVGTSPAAAAPVVPEDVVRAALARDPRVQVAAADLQGAEGERRQVSVFLQNPEVQVGTSVTGDLTFLQAQQPVSVSGEGWYARRAARAGVATEEAALRRVELEVAADARLAFAEASASALRVAWTDEAVTLATDLRRVAERRVQAGEGTEVELALARAREAVAVPTALDARTERSRASLALAELGVAGELSGRPRDAVPAASGAAPRSDVEAAARDVERRTAELARARAGSVPALSVGVQYQSDGGSTDLGPMVTVELPLWDRNGAAVGAARGALQVAAAAEGVTADRAAADVVQTRADRAWAVDQTERLSGVEDAVRRGLTAVSEGLASGELGVRDAVVLHRELIDGLLAALDVEVHTVEVSLAALLATEDAALLGEGALTPR
jgi:outer membrane protein TolC